MKLLEKKTVIITGASRGIGKGIAETLANSGYTCALIARNLKEIKNLEKKIQKNKGSAFCKTCDIIDYRGMEKII